MALLWQAAAVSAWQAAVRPCARPRTVRAGPRASASSEASSFGAALARAWQQDPTALRELLGRDVVVDTPIWSCTDAADYLEKLGEAAVFFGGSDDEFGRAGETAPAQLNVLSEQQLPSGALMNGTSGEIQRSPRAISLLQLWDQMAEQATITLNLLRTSRIDPTKSAYHQLLHLGS